jgi:3-dehydroquinate dehydratase / shikimate dehydrogenase
MICLALTGSSRQEWSRAVAANRQWIDMVELRIDMLKPAERGVDDLAVWWQNENTAKDLPAIVTVRRTQDLGRWEGDEAQRLHLVSRLVEALRPDYIDIELDRAGLPDWDRLAAMVRSEGGQVIRSHHERRSTPDDLSSLMARLAAEPQEIPKLAVMPQSAHDTARLVESARRFGKMMPGRKGIWIAMGEYGLPSRVWPAGTGSFMTYASDADSVAAAPGHISPRELRQLYRLGDASAAWPAFAVVGSPIGHSRSPEYHNSRFRQDRVDGIYLPIRMDSFDDFPLIAEIYGLRGVSVTVPHKEAALEYIRQEYPDNLSSSARTSGAVNTLWRDNDGWHGDNTDVEAFRKSLEDAVSAKLKKNLASVRVLVIGAGGAARAVVSALSGRVASVVVANRSVHRLGALAERFGISRKNCLPLSGLSGLPPGSVDLVVQTTSVGMENAVPGDPSAGYAFAGTELAYDVIYTPAVTPFLRRAGEAGCATVNGATMFQGQAELQYHRYKALL